MNSRRIRVIDTHTGGEPTRVVVDGAPDLGSDGIDVRRDRFRDEFDTFRSAVVNEPRGSDVMVGALIVEPVRPSSAAGVIFFNNVSTLNMCGHGTIGVAIALAADGTIGPGTHILETAVGDVSLHLHDDVERVSIENVPSWRYKKDVTVGVEGYGPIVGDIAWGGNWFFLVSEHDQTVEPSCIGKLLHFTRSIRNALEMQGITGHAGALIDHIEIFGPPSTSQADSRNFVLCPGGAYDRSACGTGTSAKIACLAADGKLQSGEVLRQESIIGSLFEASYEPTIDEKVIPTITGSAWVMAESFLVFDDRDPFRFGIRR